MKKKVIKSTKYCDLLLQASLNDSEYTYCIERIYVKAKKTEEIRFSLYKDTIKSDNRYIPRSLDVTELELIELIKESISRKVFSEGFIEMLKQEINKI
ncbi:hypothetical protein NSA50_13535 [Clostridium sp. DSM 100503]|uniref:hypothetical protein n=1 Tax=Clostridium sp. DSM 100503 TaxID=2963282 RepID=UPI00214A2CFC|nr:hypothetical protein [Clostridium sp. DSM 100503]MCR1952066.1 hypothetical protein [Clostridium sp. DSM 100503]